MELWDIYDKDRSKTNRLAERGKPLAKGDFHLVVHICIFSPDGRMLIQQRQPFKQGWPNLWDVTVGGSAIAGENSAAAAGRELFEEIGCRVDFSDERPFLTLRFERGFDDWYLLEKDVTLSELTLQQEEVQNVRWAGMEEILQMIEEGSFIPYYQSFIRLLFEMRKYRGGIQPS